MVKRNVENGGGPNEAEKSKKAHVLFVTIGFSGHCAPLIQLLYHLEAKYSGLTVTVWSNKDRIGELKQLQGKGDLKGLDIRLEETFGPLPLQLEDPVFPIRSYTTSAKSFEESEPFRKKLIAQKDTLDAPTAIVSDMFQPWSKTLADELGIPWYTYFSTGPYFIMNVIVIPRLVETGIHPVTSANLNELLEPSFQGLPAVRIRDLSEEAFFLYENYYLDIIDQTKSASAILLNTSEGLDSLAGSVVAARQIWPSTRILPIGPSVQYPGFGYSSAFSTSGWALEWLDSRPSKSVLYIAFGTLGAVSKELVLELAAGLQASGVSFLWALKVDPRELSEWLPPGFQEYTKDRGVIETGWAPQARILAHVSTGGFLSHCGWNSTLESLSAGVPIIAWPLSTEQFMNSRFIADVAKLGLAVCYFKEQNQDSYEGITRREVEKAVRQLMVEEKGNELRTRAAEMQKSLYAAVEEGGSSYQNLHTLLDELAA